MIALLLALALNAGQLDELPIAALPTPTQVAPVAAPLPAPPTPPAQSVTEIVVNRALAHHVSSSALVGLARCESSLNPLAVGDHGRSLGLMQLNRAGYLPRFFADGYTDPFDVWQAADFTAGEIAAGNGGAWSCWGLARGTG